MSHYEWQVIRQQSDRTWAIIGTYLDPDKAAQAVARSKDVLPRSEVRIRRRRVTVHHGAWEDVA